MVKISHSGKSGDKGFTLIELLIVIAIIGVLAATVLVSLGSQTNSASSGSVKLGVSSLRTLALVEVTIESSKLTGQKLCNNIYEDVSGEKGAWEWTEIRQCEDGDLIASGGFTSSSASGRASGENAKAGEICCHAKDKKWVVWGALPDADGRNTSPAKTGKDVYCADSNGFLGELDLSVAANLNTAAGKAECRP